jgi:spore maturation protein CgeB
MLTNVKARDFEIPAVGTSAYLTSFNPDLAQHFFIGREVLCYRNHEEMLELIRFCLARPDEASAIARRGKMRCLAEHRWRNRFERICRILGILPGD